MKERSHGKLLIILLKRITKMVRNKRILKEKIVIKNTHVSVALPSNHVELQTLRTFCSRRLLFAVAENTLC